MSKKIKYGKVEVPTKSFELAEAIVPLSIPIPLPVFKEVRRLIQTTKYAKDYKSFIVDLISQKVLELKDAERKSSNEPS